MPTAKAGSNAPRAFRTPRPRIIDPLCCKTEGRMATKVQVSRASPWAGMKGVHVELAHPCGLGHVAIRLYTVDKRLLVAKASTYETCPTTVSESLVSHFPFWVDEVIAVVESLNSCGKTFTKTAALRL